MTRYYEPGEPVELDVGAGETVWHAEIHFDELERPVHLAVVATDRDAAREQVLDFTRRTFAGVGHPTVAIFAPEEWLAR